MATAIKTKVDCNTFSSLCVEVFSERDEELFVEVRHIWIEGRLHVCWNGGSREGKELWKEVSFLEMPGNGMVLHSGST